MFKLYTPNVIIITHFLKYIWYFFKFCGWLSIWTSSYEPPPRLHEQRSALSTEHVQWWCWQILPAREPVCKVFTTLLIGVSMVETLFTPVYGTVHWTRLSVYSCMDMLYRCYLLYSTHGPTLCKLPRYAPVRAHTTSVCCYNNITIN